MAKPINSGPILEIPLPLERGYGYGKLMDFRNVNSFSGILIKIYDVTSDRRLDDINRIVHNDWLFGANMLYNFPPLRGTKNAWRKIGEHLQKEDLIIPDFKGSMSIAIVVDDESTIESWFPIYNLTERGEFCSYENIRHLEISILNTPQAISERIVMELLRRENKDISQYFDLKDIGTRNVYQRMKNVPIYRDIPAEIRGKALCEDRPEKIGLPAR